MASSLFDGTAIVLIFYLLIVFLTPVSFNLKFFEILLISFGGLELIGFVFEKCFE